MTTPIKGRSLELYFIDGRADGMLTAKVFNWTGHVLLAPRTQIGDALKRSEAEHVGVYLLIGEQNGAPMAYIGEGENIAERIRTHDTRKDWWTTAVLVTTSANELNKAHVKYLEARLIENARRVGRAQLENTTAPSRPALSEAAQSSMEEFLEQLQTILPAIRVDLFVDQTRPQIVHPAEAELASESPTFEIVSKKHGVRATAKLVNGEFVVQAGSTARREWGGKGYEQSSYGTLYQQLVASGVLQDRDKTRVFTTNYAFKSTSAAGAAVLGRSAAGPREWRVMGGRKTFQEWESDMLTKRDLETEYGLKSSQQ